MTTKADPYRESAEAKAPKSWRFRAGLWLHGVRERIFAFGRTAVGALWKIFVLLTFALVPAVIAHQASVYSWHWLVCPAMVASAICAMLLFWAKDGEQIAAVCALGFIAYAVTLIALGTIAAAKLATAPACKDAVLDREYAHTCPHEKHKMKILERGKDIYLECRCEQ